MCTKYRSWSPRTFKNEAKLNTDTKSGFIHSYRNFLADNAEQRAGKGHCLCRIQAADLDLKGKCLFRSHVRGRPLTPARGHFFPRGVSRCLTRA